VKVPEGYNPEHAGAHVAHPEAIPEKDAHAGNTPPSYPDPEKGIMTSEPTDSDSEEVIRARELQKRSGVLRSLRAGEEWLDRKMGIETQGIDRIHEEDKKPPSILNVFFLWWSLTCHVGTLPIGVLGPEFGLSLGQSVAMIIVGTVLGALCTSYTGTLGPKVSRANTLKRSKLTLAARSSCDCHFSILLRFLRRQALLRSQRSHWRWIRRGKRCGCWTNSRSRLGLHHDHRCWVCDHRSCQLRDLHLRLRDHPHLREILLDHDLHHTLRSDRTNRTKSRTFRPSY